MLFLFNVSHFLKSDLRDKHTLTEVLSAVPFEEKKFLCPALLYPQEQTQVKKSLVAMKF